MVQEVQLWLSHTRKVNNPAHDTDWVSSSSLGPKAWRIPGELLASGLHWDLKEVGSNISEGTA